MELESSCLNPEHKLSCDTPLGMGARPQRAAGEEGQLRLLTPPCLGCALQEALPGSCLSCLTPGPTNSLTGMPSQHCWQAGDNPITQEGPTVQIPRHLLGSEFSLQHQLGRADCFACCFLRRQHTAFGSFSRQQIWKMKKGSSEYSNPDMFALAVTLDSKQVTQARLGSPA